MSDPKISAIKTERPPLITYDVVLRTAEEKLTIRAEYVNPGSHWVEFYKQGKRVALFPTSSIGFVLACTPEGNVLE